MKYLIAFTLIMTYIAGCNTPRIYEAAHIKFVDYVFAWAAEQKVPVNDGYAMPDRKELTQLFERVKLEKIEGIN